MAKKTQILFDGNCIVCDFEVSHYKRLAPDRFDLLDISSPSFDSKKYGLSKEAVEKHLHLITSEGELKVGVDAFAHIWSQIPRYRLGSALIKSPVVYQAAQLGYSIFALLRPYLPKKSR